jgi:hypothetical protein
MVNVEGGLVIFVHSVAFRIWVGKTP